MSVAIPVRVPLLNGGKASFADRLKQRIDSLRNITVSKPGRRLGGAYIDEKVSERRVVTLCQPCVFKYGNWYKRTHYHADWGWNYIGDCAGCGEVNTKVTLFHAEEKFYEVLTEAHGKNTKPF